MTLAVPAVRAQQLRDAVPGNVHLIGTAVPGKLAIDYYYSDWTPDEAKAHGMQAAKALEFHMLSDDYGDVLVRPMRNYEDEDGEPFNYGNLYVVADDNRAIRETLLLADGEGVFDLPSLQENQINGRLYKERLRIEAEEAELASVDDGGTGL